MLFFSKRIPTLELISTIVLIKRNMMELVDPLMRNMLIILSDASKPCSLQLHLFVDFYFELVLNFDECFMFSSFYCSAYTIFLEIAVIWDFMI